MSEFPASPAAEEPRAPRARVHFHSLGCPKNQLDTEVMLGALALEDYAIAERLEDADVAIVNTCAFIESAREESIQAILDVADLRDSGRLRALLVTGCMPQRYGDELARELPEVDAFIGTSSYHQVPHILDEALAGRRGGVYVEARRTHLYDDTSPRILVGPGHSAYVKTSEGCDRVCAFCAIPGIRGAFQSRGLDSLVRETRDLAAAGVREINLVAQDQTSWGKDLPGRPKLATLLRALDAVEPPEEDGSLGRRHGRPHDRPHEWPDWIRLLYVYPTAVSDELIDVIAGARRVLPYVDVPLQHASDPVLKAMRRGVTADRQHALVERLRRRIPDLTLRTTFLVGFPGETDRDFETLLDFVRATRFDRVGVFRYSDEEGTAAAALPGKVPRRVARERHRALMTLQQQIMAEKHADLVGREVELLVDHAGPHGAQARMASQAPEIDGGVFLKAGAAGESVATGELVRARISGLRDRVDLEAELV